MRNKNGFFICLNCSRKFLLQVTFENHKENSHKPGEELKQDHIMKNGVITRERQNSTVAFANPFPHQKSAQKTVSFQMSRL